MDGKDSQTEYGLIKMIHNKFKCRGGGSPLSLLFLMCKSFIKDNRFNIPKFSVSLSNYVLFVKYNVVTE